MKDKNVFEKARMNAVLIPLAGFIAAAALIPAVISAAAYFGAFTYLSDKESGSDPVFEEPEKPEYSLDIETVNENPLSVVEIEVVKFKSGDDKTVSYKIDLKNESEAFAKIKEVRCMIYGNGRCVKSSSLANGLTLDGGGSKTLSGTAEAEGADAFIFYVSWEDENGASADTYYTVNKE